MLIALLLVREGRVRRGQLGEKERSDGHGNDASVTVVPVSVHLVCCYACQVTEYSRPGKMAESNATAESGIVR